MFNLICHCLRSYCCLYFLPWFPTPQTLWGPLPVYAGVILTLLGNGTQDPAFEGPFRGIFPCFCRCVFPLPKNRGSNRHIWVHPVGFVEVLEYGTARVRPGACHLKGVRMVPANGYSMVPQDPETGGWWLEHDFYCLHILGIRIPIDELIYFTGVNHQPAKDGSVKFCFVFALWIHRTHFTWGALAEDLSMF